MGLQGNSGIYKDKDHVGVGEEGLSNNGGEVFYGQGGGR